MTAKLRFILPCVAGAVLLAGAPLPAQEAAAGGMKCKMMADGKEPATADVVGKLTAKKKELKLSDRQIRDIAAALAQPPACCADMMKMKGMQMKADGDKTAGHEEHQKHE